MNAIVPSVLEGELLGPSDTIRVVAALHPLRHQRIELRLPAGVTLAEIVDRIVAEPACLSAPQDFLIHLDGHAIERRNWHRVRPKPSTTVVLRPSLQGFLAPLIGAIGTAFATFQGWIASLGFLGKILMTGLSIGVKMLVNAIFAPRPPKQETPKIGYSFSGARNQVAPFEAVPSHLGRHRYAPLYGGLPYTETVGNDQYLRVLYVWGYGPLQVEELKIGETLLSSFEEVEIQTYQGFPGDPEQTLYPQQVIEEPLNVKIEHSAGWQRRTTAENITHISIDVVFPSGIVLVNDRGKKGPWAVGIYIRYRLFGDVDWIDLPQLICRGQTQDTLRFSTSIEVAAGQYEVELSRAQAEYTGDEFNIAEDGYWTALRGFRPGTPITFQKPLCITAIRIKATSQLNGTLDTLNGIVTSLVKSWNGADWVDNQPSRNPADLYRHVLQGPANARPTPDGQIDIVALQEWHQYCTDRGWTFDNPRTGKASVFDTLADICAAGRAIPIFKDGKWSVVWDEQDTPVVQMFTPRNSWGLEVSHAFRELPHGWRVKFVNEVRGWVEDERIVYDDGYSDENATRFEGIEFPGVTNPDAIWKHGRFHLAQLRLRPETYTLNVDFEHLICTRGDRVRVAHDVMLVGQVSGRVVHVDAGTQTVELDEEVTFVAPAYCIRFRLADGTFVLRPVTTGSGSSTRTIQLEGPGDLPAAGDLFTFGESGRETAVYRVLGIETLDDMAARITLVDDAPEIYDADTGSIPAFESRISAPVDPFMLPPTDLRMTSRVYVEGDSILVVVRLSWVQPRLGRVRLYEVEYKPITSTARSSAAQVPAPATSAEVFGLDDGHYGLRVRTIFDDGSFSRWVESEILDTGTLLTPPPDVSGFKIATIGDLSTLSWDAVRVVGISHYEIRFASAESGLVAWNSASPLVPVVSTTSVQVPTMVGTYLIKAVHQSGMQSSGAALVESNIAALSGLNVVETFVEHPAFSGSKHNVTVEGGRLQLLTNNTMSKWPTLDVVDTLSAGTGEPDSLGVAVSGEYYFAESLDLGDVYTSRLSAMVEATGTNLANVIASWVTLAEVAKLDDTDPEGWSVVLQVRTTLSDPALDDWSDWLPLVVGDVTARAFEFRLILNGLAIATADPVYSNVTPLVSMLKVSIDMPDRVVAGEDIVVPATGLAISFNPPFIALQGLATADQDMATGDRKEISAKGPTGFHIQFFDAGGTPVERTIDYVAKGYGAMQ